MLCSQVFSIAAPGLNGSSPQSAAALPSLPLCNSIVQPSTPSLIHRPHRGNPFGAQQRSVCICVCACWVRVPWRNWVLQAFPLSPRGSSPCLHSTLKGICADWCGSSHSKRGNGTHRPSICSATHCPNWLLVWRKKKKRYNAGRLSKYRLPVSSDTDVLGTLWPLLCCFSRIYTCRKWAKLCPFLHCLFILNSLVSWLILQSTPKTVSKCSFWLRFFFFCIAIFNTG